MIKYEMILGRIMVKAEVRGKYPDTIESFIKKKNRWVKIVMSVENDEDICDDKRDMRHASIRNRFPTKLKILISKLASFMKTVE